MRKILLIATILFSLVLEAQESYKYVIIPSQFSFFKEADKYNLNTLTKIFFESEGFKVLYDTQDLPQEIANNRCNALYANAIENNSMFLTRIKIEIKDCQNKVILTSIEASSKEKSYDRAYNQVFREALTSLKGKIKVDVSDNLKVNTNQVTRADETTVLDELIPATNESEANKSQLFALPTATGFKLVDSNPNIIFELQKTSMDNIYLADRGMMDNGIFYKKNEAWYFEYYKREKLVVEKVEVKF